jgi:hypothetical protein
MYKIPTIEEKNDKRKPTVTSAHTATGFVRLEPSVYTVQQYPLVELYGYTVSLFNPFTVVPSSWRLLSVQNTTDSSFLPSVASLSGLGTNTYYKKLNALYPLLNATGVTIRLEFVVFTDLVGLTNDISIFTDQGAVLQQVNITGHIATFSSTVREFVLDSLIATKTEFPVPAALTFTMDIDLSDYTYYTVYNVPTTIGSVDYVLYNNKMYNRSRTVIPARNTFTTRSGGGLLWI